MEEFTVFIALVTGVVLLTTAALGFRAIRQEVKEIHVMVNSRMSEAVSRVDQLIDALSKAGVDIPPRPDRSDAEMH